MSTIDLKALLGTSLVNSADSQELTVRKESKQIGNEMKTEGGPAKNVTKQDIDAASRMQPIKAAKFLAEKGPIGFDGKQISGEDLVAAGYSFENTAYHIGVPVLYKSPDGGHVTVYNGKGSANMGEDVRKTVYTKDGYTQEIIYDKDGNFQKGTITIKDNVAGFTHQKYTYWVNEQGRLCVMD